jgi:hypothetical protein
MRGLYPHSDPPSDQRPDRPVRKTHFDFTKYERMQPVYTEYNVGHWLVLPKTERAQPRKIKVG